MYNQSFTNISLLPERDFHNATKTPDLKSPVDHDKFSHYRKFSTYDKNDISNKDKNGRTMNGHLVGDKRVSQNNG